jgi:diguanylate cyclase (GGDEF)-like protein
MDARPIRVLIVDDDEDDVLLARSLLAEARASRYEVTSVPAYEDALGHLDRRDIDIYLVDYRLGPRNGLDLVREARARGNPVPMIMLTGQDDFDVDLQAAKAGASDYLVKGAISAPLLERSIRYAIGHRDAQEALQEANKRLAGKVRDLEHRTREIALLGQMGNLLLSALEGSEAYSIISGYARQLFPKASGSLVVTNASRNRAETVAAWGDGPAGERVFPPDACWALRNVRPHGADGDTATALCPHAGPVPPGTATLCLPLMSRNEMLGLLHLRAVAQGPGAPPPLTGDERQLAAALAEQAALSLSNLRLKESLRRQAIRDPLTNLFNRRYLEESLDREVHRAQRKGTGVGILMLDIDHFKPYNDAHGHAAGDILLRTLGTHLLACVRTEDIACRYGGEEFVLILPDASLENTLRRAEQIREGVSRLDASGPERPLGAVTVSIGVAAFPEHGKTLGTLLGAADAALYAAKSAGRNRVVVAPCTAGEPGILPARMT